MNDLDKLTDRINFYYIEHKKEFNLIYKEELLNFIKFLYNEIQFKFVDNPSFLIPISDKLKKFDSSKYAYIKSTIDLSDKIEDNSYIDLIKDCNKRFVDNYEKEAIEYYKTIGKNLYIHNIYISEIFDADKNWLVYKIILILNGVFISDIIKKEKSIKLNSI